LLSPYTAAIDQWVRDAETTVAFFVALPERIWGGIIAFVNGPLVGAFLILGNVLTRIDQILVGASVVPALELFLTALMFLDAILKAILKPVQDLATALVESVFVAFITVYNIAVQLGAMFGNALWSAMNDLYNIGMILFELLYNSLWTAFNDLVSVVQTLVEAAGGVLSIPEDAGDAVEAGANTAVDVGTAIVEGIANFFGVKLHNGGIYNPAYAAAGMGGEGLAVLQRGEGVISTTGMRNLEQMSGTTAAGALASIEAGRNPFFGGAAPYQAPYQPPAPGVVGGGRTGGGEQVEETTIQVDVKFEGCQFSSEDTADQVEQQITNKLRNRQGNIYTEIRKVKKPKTSVGIRPR
jgi:hypothetical protein